jgi:hypothetical protein
LYTGISQVGGFSPDMTGFDIDCMSGLKPPTYNWNVGNCLDAAQHH